MTNNDRSALPFWQSKNIDSLTDQEWESLCDGCGLCCMQKLQDEETEEVFFTCISCQYLDSHSCQCRVYEKRFEYLPECLNLTKENLQSTLPWLPPSCAYKLVYEGKDLPEWHHLKSLNTQLIHLKNLSAKDKVVCELNVNEDDWEDFIIDL